MDKNLLIYLLGVCRAFNANGVQYLIVGGVAVAFHGYFRLSREEDGTVAEKYDIDIWYNPTYDNYFRLLNALETLEFDVADFRSETSPDPEKSYFKLDLPEYKLDLLPALPGFKRFRAACSNKVVMKKEGVDIPYISFDDLILNKTSLGRARDLEDIAALYSVKMEGKDPGAGEIK